MAPSNESNFVKCWCEVQVIPVITDSKSTNEQHRCAVEKLGECS